MSLLKWANFAKREIAYGFESCLWLIGSKKISLSRILLVLNIKLFAILCTKFRSLNNRSC